MRVHSSQHIFRGSKSKRLREVLLGAVRYYIAHAKPVGSKALQGAGFRHLSSATIRNYFAELEKMGFFRQLHASGGRIPTDQAYSIYVGDLLEKREEKEEEIQEEVSLDSSETREVARYLQEKAEVISRKTEAATFFSSPRFDNDYINAVRLVMIDATRCLAVMLTDFGVVHSSLLHSPRKLSTHMVRRLEEYFIARLLRTPTGGLLTEEEEPLARELYNEAVMRYVVSYSNFPEEDIYRTGLSTLLRYPEFSEGGSIAGAMELYDNRAAIRLLLREVVAKKEVCYWVGRDLQAYCSDAEQLAILAAPFSIHNQPVGALAILGPSRMPYEQHIEHLLAQGRAISRTLTKNIAKHRITFRQPLQKLAPQLVDRSTHKLLENQR